MTVKSCPFCHKDIDNSLVGHIRAEHGETVLRAAVLEDKQNGLPDVRIGEKYGISYSSLERMLTEVRGTNVSTTARKRTKIAMWEPKGYKPETTTIWSFKNRGNWATHDGHYRGNWSPFIPRNLILHYSKPGDLVLDYFVGGGTTAVEAKLLSRRCTALDINPEALALTRENLDFQIPPGIFEENGNCYQPELTVGDARNLQFIDDESIDLICAHPPYAGIINYSADRVEGDLSSLSVNEFIDEIQKVARESFRVLKSGHKCAILIGDTRKEKHIIPIAFRTIRAFLNAGFVLKELIIKRQHNCKTTGFWYSNSIKYNFLLLAHEFLPIFEKPKAATAIGEMKQLSWFTDVQIQQTIQEIERVEKDKLETTSVWIFPAIKLEEEIRRNLVGRFSQNNDDAILECKWGETTCANETRQYNLAYIHFPPDSILATGFSIEVYCKRLQDTVTKIERALTPKGYCIIETRDFRLNGYTIPVGMLAFENLVNSKLDLRELVIVTSEENKLFQAPSNDDFDIAHRYLLIYRKL
jgi:DNA modification methylase